MSIVKYSNWCSSSVHDVRKLRIHLNFWHQHLGCCWWTQTDASHAKHENQFLIYQTKTVNSTGVNFAILAGCCARSLFFTQRK